MYDITKVATKKLTTTKTTNSENSAALPASRSSLNSPLGPATKFKKFDTLHAYPGNFGASTITTTTSSPSLKADTAFVELSNPAHNTHMLLLSQRRRRLLQRHACLLSIIAAFILGMVLGVLLPMLSLTKQTTLENPHELMSQPALTLQVKNLTTIQQENQEIETARRTYADFPTIYKIQTTQQQQPAKPTTPLPPYAVAFVQASPGNELNAAEVFRNAFHVEQLPARPNAMLVKKLDPSDGSIREYQVERLSKGRYRKGAEKRLSRPTQIETILSAGKTKANELPPSIVPLAQRILANAQAAQPQQQNIITDDIYWGDVVEQALPQGFNQNDAKQWNNYVNNIGIVKQFEIGCGRMQNRLVVFADGTKACARYRQNTDQIQGEIFSFYLGQLLNISNLAPSAATVVDLNAATWASALPDITQAQWQQKRPLVLTRWLPDLEPASIPRPFQPLKRHLNKYDVWNISSDFNMSSKTSRKTESRMLRGLGLNYYEHVDGNPSRPHNQSASNGDDVAAATPTPTSTPPSSSTPPTPAVLRRLVELAQWSDLIVFDYLIANLDRVVNNLYNFQWNADIMAAPAHNLARQTATQLLVFLDNESGLLHGYRLLKKYEAYHAVLLDNLCVFRRPTIEALRQLRHNDPARILREIFERTTNSQVRDVLPSLPDKSIKILVDRIDRVLGQVQKCKHLLSDHNENYHDDEHDGKNILVPSTS